MFISFSTSLPYLSNAETTAIVRKTLYINRLKPMAFEKLTYVGPRNTRSSLLIKSMRTTNASPKLVRMRYVKIKNLYRNPIHDRNARPTKNATTILSYPRNLLYRTSHPIKSARMINVFPSHQSVTVVLQTKFTIAILACQRIANARALHLMKNVKMTSASVVRARNARLITFAMRMAAIQSPQRQLRLLPRAWWVPSF